LVVHSGISKFSFGDSRRPWLAAAIGAGRVADPVGRERLSGASLGQLSMFVSFRPSSVRASAAPSVARLGSSKVDFGVDFPDFTTTSRRIPHFFVLNLRLGASYIGMGTIMNDPPRETVRLLQRIRAGYRRESWGSGTDSRVKQRGTFWFLTPS
jgi:hypothetical protein